MKLRSVLGFLALFVAGSANAAPYGMAGCGLGSILIKTDTWMMQTFAGTTNGSSMNQSFGITMGTSNCGAQAKTAKLLRQEDYVASNLKSLSKDIAIGEGHTLTGFAEVLGCDSSVHGEFQKTAKDSHSRIFAAPGAGAVLDEAKAVFKENKVLNGRCTGLVI